MDTSACSGANSNRLLTDTVEGNYSPLLVQCGPTHGSLGVGRKSKKSDDENRRFSKDAPEGLHIW